MMNTTKKQYKGYLIAGNTEQDETLDKPWTLTCFGAIIWDGNDRTELDAYTDDFKNVIGIWYPELGYFLQNNHVYWKGNSFSKDSSEFNYATHNKNKQYSQINYAFK